VFFIPIQELIQDICVDSRVKYDFDFEASKAALSESQSEVLELANGIDQQLREMTYFIHDPLDFKYGRWLQKHAYSPTSIPLVPGLSIQVGDAGGGLEGLGKVLCGWAKLASIGSAAEILPVVDANRSKSFVVDVLTEVWHMLHGRHSISSGAWEKVPKLALGSKWPITKKEILENKL